MSSVLCPHHAVKGSTWISEIQNGMKKSLSLHNTGEFFIKNFSANYFKTRQIYSNTTCDSNAIQRLLINR